MRCLTNVASAAPHVSGRGTFKCPTSYNKADTPRKGCSRFCQDSPKHGALNLVLSQSVRLVRMISVIALLQQKPYRKGRYHVSVTFLSPSQHLTHTKGLHQSFLNECSAVFHVFIKCQETIAVPPEIANLQVVYQPTTYKGLARNVSLGSFPSSRKLCWEEDVPELHSGLRDGHLHSGPSLSSNCGPVTPISGVHLEYRACTTRLFPLCLGVESLYVVLSPHKYRSAVSGDRDT